MNAVTLSGPGGTIAGTTIDSDGEDGEPVQPDQGQINSVWYRFTPTASGSAHFDTCTDVLYDGYMASYTGPAVNQLTNIGFNDDGCGGFGTGSVLDFDVTAGTTYSIAIDGWEVEIGDFTLTYTIPGGPPPPPPRHLRHHRHPATSATTATSASATPATSATTATATATASASASASASPPPPARCRVPRVIGFRLRNARQRIRRANCSVGRVRRVRTRRSLRGRVIGQSPRPGAVRRAASRSTCWWAGGKRDFFRLRSTTRRR